MPILGADMSEGTLVAWRKQLGDSVQRGDIIAEVETDKAEVEVEAFTTGVLEKVLIQPGERVPVGTVLAIIRQEGETAEVGEPGLVPTSLPPLPTRHVASQAPSHRRAPLAGAPRATPLARNLAAKLGVDLSTVTGSGPGGRIQERDVEQAAQTMSGVPVMPTTAPDRQARMRQAIAAAMSRSNQEIPHFYLATTIDMSRALSWLTAQNEKRPVTGRLLPGVLFLKAVARALRDVPELNAVWHEGKVNLQTDIHVGVAISLRGGGLVAPALHHTDQQDLNDLMRDFRDLVQRARKGSLRSSELSDATITVTSLGDQGVEAVFGLIYPPQVGLVGFGRIVERPWSVDGQIESRPVITVTLAADHRVLDGHRGSIFLSAIDKQLQEPDKL